MKSQIYGFVKKHKDHDYDSLQPPFQLRKDGLYAVNMVVRKESERRQKSQPLRRGIKNRKDNLYENLH